MTTHDQFIDAYEEAVLRENADGIPRYVTTDGKIMKYDWELDPDWEPPFDIEEHIANLLAQQS